MNRLKELRLSAGLSQAALAAAADTTQRNISFWESGNVELNLYAAIRLAQIFQVDVEYLAGYSDEFDVKPDINFPARISAPSSPPAPISVLTEKEKALLEAFGKLLPETQDFILRTAQSLSDDAKEKTLK